jgi:hypothetical protein
MNVRRQGQPPGRPDSVYGFGRIDAVGDQTHGLVTRKAQDLAAEALTDTRVASSVISSAGDLLQPG